MKHPAKYSAALMPVLQSLVPPEEFPLVLDPFAGTGKIHGLANLTWGIELEPEWAEMSVRTSVGDATALPFFTGDFNAVVTSPCYGNRMADHHEAKDKCKHCQGLGYLPGMETMTTPGLDRPCSPCSGTGLSRRNTYRHVLGRMPSEGSAAVLQWGDAYRTLHRAAWAEAWRVLLPGGRIVVNIKDHIRNHKQQYVSWWHYQALIQQGFVPHRFIWVPTPGQRDGQNGAARMDGEWVFSFDKP